MIVVERQNRLIFNIYIRKVSIKFELSTFATFHSYCAINSYKENHC